MASSHCIAHRNQGRGLGGNGTCSMCSQGWRTGIQVKGLLHQSLYSLHSLLCSSPTFLALSACATSKAYKVGQSWGGVFWNEAIYSLSFCEFQDDHRLSNTELEQKYGTNIIRVSHQGNDRLGDKHPDCMRKNAGLRRLWVT